MRRMEFPAFLPFALDFLHSEFTLPSKNHQEAPKVKITEESFIYSMTALMLIRMHEKKPVDRPNLTEVLQYFSLLQTFVENLQRAVRPSAKAQVREKYFILLKVILSIASKDLARDEITDAATIYYVKEKILILGSQYPVHHYFAECKK